MEVTETMKNIYVVCEVLNYYGYHEDHKKTNCVKAFTKRKEAEDFMDLYIQAQRNGEDANGNVEFCYCYIDTIPLKEEED